jgi:hypothetical protein
MNNLRVRDYSYKHCDNNADMSKPAAEGGELINNKDTCGVAFRQVRRREGAPLAE